MKRWRGWHRRRRLDRAYRFLLSRMAPPPWPDLKAWTTEHPSAHAHGLTAEGPPTDPPWHFHHEAGP